MLLTSFAEMLSIGAVLPFLGVLTAPERLFENATAQLFIGRLGLATSGQLLLPFTIIFSVAALIAGAMRLLLLWASTRLSFAAGADLSFSIYRRTLYQSYAVHCARNSSEVIDGISSKANGVIYNIIVPAITLVSSCVMLIVVLIALLLVQPVIVLTGFVGFALIYSVIVRLSRDRLLANSQCIAHESTQVIKALQEGLSGIRDVLIDGSQATYCEVYRNSDLPLRRAQGNNIFIAGSPRYGIEALGMILIASLAYLLAQQAEGVTGVIPILGTLALGAQRLLPVLQQAYGSWTQIRSGQAALQDSLGLLDQPLPDHACGSAVRLLPFRSNIKLKQLRFRYGSTHNYVLNELNLTIAKGDRVGFIGATGSGKSTLLDIIMGLLEPTDGTLEIDGVPIVRSNYRAWQLHIAHVPQSIFLADCSIEENIAFGVSKNQVDSRRVRKAAHLAQIAETIECLHDQYDTFVGERGIRLSGGQRQRIGIARALYKQADVIILDEATSALDNETERAVMQAIEALSGEITLLIIAHRLTTLKGCTQIVELGAGGIVRTGTYQEIIDQTAGLQTHNLG